MNWKLPNQLRHVRRFLLEMGEDSLADVCEEAAKEIEIDRRIIINDPVELPIEEGDRANG